MAKDNGTYPWMGVILPSVMGPGPRYGDMATDKGNNPGWI